MLIFTKPVKREKKSKVREWEKARRKLKVEYEARNIMVCEIKLKGCLYNNALSFAHRYKRRDPRTTHDYKGTLLACLPCHQLLERSKALTDYYFKLLR